MREHKSFFKNVLDAMIESRSRQAAREVAYHRWSMGIDQTPRTGR